MLDKIKALAPYLGSTILAAGIVGATIIANAGDTVSATSDDPTAAPTGPQSLALAACIQADVPEVVVSATQEIHLWRSDRPEECDGEADPCPRGVGGYTAELMTGDDDVFSALAMAKPSVLVGGVGCEHTRDEAGVNSFCIKRGPFVLSTVAKACIATAARAVTPDLSSVERLTMRRGPPLELEVKRGLDLTTEEFAICHAAGACKPVSN